MKRTTHSLPFLAVLLLPAILATAACDKEKDIGSGAAADKGLGAANGGVPTSREGQMFLLGTKLTQAAMVNGRAEPAIVARTFGAAQTIADITLSLKLDPLEAVTGDRAKDGAAGLHYMLDGGGKTVINAIDAQHGASALAAYELAVKLNMIPILYIDDPKDTMPDSLAQKLEQLGSKLGLPATELAPMIGKLRARASMDEVTDLVFDLNDQLAIAIGVIFEKASDAK